MHQLCWPIKPSKSIYLLSLWSPYVSSLQTRTIDDSYISKPFSCFANPDFESNCSQKQLLMDTLLKIWFYNVLLQEMKFVCDANIKSILTFTWYLYFMNNVIYYNTKCHFWTACCEIYKLWKWTLNSHFDIYFPRLC